MTLRHAARILLGISSALKLAIPRGLRNIVGE